MNGQRTMPQGQQLFDPATTDQPRCDHCNTTRRNLCKHDADLEQGLVSITRRRPRTCLNGYDPSTAEIPY